MQRQQDAQDLFDALTETPMEMNGRTSVGFHIREFSGNMFVCSEFPEELVREVLLQSMNRKRSAS